MEKVTSIKDRIIQIADIKGIKREIFFKEINASYSNFRGKSKNSSPSADVLVEISSQHPDVNLNWVLNNVGEPLFNNNEKVSEPEIIYNTLKKGVPYYDVDFTASFLEVENNQQTQPDSYISHPFFINCDLVARASGQSMAKIIKHGDAIGLKKIENWFDFIPMGEVYAIVTKNNFRMIKIITRGENPDSYTLLSKPSVNKKDEFPPQQIQKDQILYLYKVQASATLF